MINSKLNPIDLHEGGGQGEELIPFECYSQKGFSHLPIAYLRR